MKRLKIGEVTKIVVDIFFCLGILCVIGVPFLCRLLRSQYDYDAENMYIMMAVLFTSGICAVYMLCNFKRMFKTLSEDNPFVKENIVRFSRLAAASAAIAVIYIVKCFLNRPL